MKTREKVFEVVENGRESRCLDGRDYSRLVNFFPVKDWETFGLEPKEGVKIPEPKPWTKDKIVAQLKDDVEFGFEKALDCRGISASLMNECVKLWLWILDDPLQDHDDYPQYGLPLLKAVALKFGFPNEIGDDTGSEEKYEEG